MSRMALRQFSVSLQPEQVYYLGSLLFKSTGGLRGAERLWVRDLERVARASICYRVSDKLKIFITSGTVSPPVQAVNPLPSLRLKNQQLLKSSSRAQSIVIFPFCGAAKGSVSVRGRKIASHAQIMIAIAVFSRLLGFAAGPGEIRRQLGVEVIRHPTTNKNQKIQTVLR